MLSAVDPDVYKRQVMTSAVKDISGVLENLLERYNDDEFPGGTVEYYDAENEGIWLEMENARFARFTDEQYETCLLYTSNTGKRYDPPVVNPVDEQGKYTDTPWKGRFVMEDGLDIEIIKWLAEEDKIFAKEKIVHNYPHCWRCGTPLVYYAKPSWYIEMTKLKDQLVANNNTVNWFPDFVGEKRFGNWLENVNDWAISRNRYWGTPIPIWRCECGHLECIGSRKELVEKAQEDITEDIELHRP